MPFFAPPPSPRPRSCCSSKPHRSTTRMTTDQGASSYTTLTDVALRERLALGLRLALDPTSSAQPPQRFPQTLPVLEGPVVKDLRLELLEALLAGPFAHTRRDPTGSYCCRNRPRRALQGLSARPAGRGGRVPPRPRLTLPGDAAPRNVSRPQARSPLSRISARRPLPYGWRRGPPRLLPRLHGTAGGGPSPPTILESSESPRLARGRSCQEAKPGARRTPSGRRGPLASATASR